MISVVASKRVGIRTELGTDWPVEDVVQRHEFSGRVKWILARGVCNGIPTSSESFATRREALAAL